MQYPPQPFGRSSPNDFVGVLAAIGAHKLVSSHRAGPVGRLLDDRKATELESSAALATGKKQGNHADSDIILDIGFLISHRREKRSVCGN